MEARRRSTSAIMTARGDGRAAMRELFEQEARDQRKDLAVTNIEVL